MPKNTCNITTGDFVDRIEQEGLEYTVLHYFDVNQLKDVRLRKAAVKVEKSINELKEILKEYGHPQD